MKSRIISFMLALFMLFSIAANAATLAGTLKINPGYLKIEAETLVEDKESAEIIEHEKAFGKKAVITNDDELSFTVSTTASDNKVWIRYSSVDKGNTIITKVGELPEKKIFLTHTNSMDNFGWMLLAIHPKPGSNSIDISLKASGEVYVDSIVISRIAGYFPPDKEELYNDIGEIIPQPNYGYEKPSIPIEVGHPRVMFTKDDIPRIKANMQTEQNIAAYNEFRTLADTETDGMLDTSAATNHNTRILDIIQAKAFDYAVFGNEENGRQAIKAMENYLDTVSWADSTDSNMTSYHYQTHCAFKTGIVYDWCYDLLTDEMKHKFVYRVQNMISWCFCGWPLINNIRGYFVGEACANAYLRDILTLGIATYDEYPDIYDYIGSLILTNYIDIRDHFYKSESQFQGSQYGYYVLYADLWAQKLFEAISGKRVMQDDIYKTTEYYIHLMLPNEDVFKECDDMMTAVGTLSPLNYNGYAAFISCVASDALKDEYIKNYQKKVSNNYTYFVSGTGEFTAVEHLIFNDPEVSDKNSYRELPKTKYFIEPKGSMHARTSWDEGIGSKSAVAMMKISTDYVTYHQNNDAGSFQLYYKGMLAQDQGQYARTDNAQYHAHHSNTISHNSLLIYDPDENFELMNSYDINSNSGGQRRFGKSGRVGQTLEDYLNEREGYYKTGEIIGAEYGPDLVTPEYSYIAGDIESAYSEKAEEVKRHMLFMPEKSEDGEAVFFVFDKIKTSKPFKKTFLLQAFEEPEIENNRIILRRTVDNYDGQLTSYVLAPSDYKIEPIGGEGKQWYVNGVNYVPLASYVPALHDNPFAYGWGRIEIYPEEKRIDDYFLNAMYLSDTTETAQVKEAIKIETDDVLGGVLLSKAAIFAKGSQRASKDLSFTLPSDKEYSIAVANVMQGEWTVTVNGNETFKCVSTKDGGIIYFKGKGEIKLSLTDKSKTEKEFTENYVHSEKNTDTELRINSRLIYSDTSPEIKEDKLYIPLRTFCNYAGFELEWNQEEKSATINRFGSQIKLFTEGTKAFNEGVEVKLEEPVLMKNGSMMIGSEIATRFFGATLENLSNRNAVNVVVNLKIQASDNPDIIPIIDATWTPDSVGSGYFSFDGSGDTRWYSQGDDEWIIWNLQRTDLISSIMLFPNTNTDRVYYFDMYVSDDGENFEFVKEIVTNGKGEREIINLDKPVRGKYVKFIGHGNSVTEWCNITEIEFYNKPQKAKEK